MPGLARRAWLGPLAGVRSAGTGSRRGPNRRRLPSLSRLRKLARTGLWLMLSVVVVAAFLFESWTDSAVGGATDGSIVRITVPDGPGALENAVGLPEAEELVIDGLTIEEWQGLQDALARS